MIGGEPVRVRGTALRIARDPTTNMSPLYYGVTDGSPADTFDVILRPSLDAARRTVTMTEIHGGEITIRGVQRRMYDSEPDTLEPK